MYRRNLKVSDSRTDKRRNNYQHEEERQPKKRKMRVIQDDDNYSECFERTKKLKNFDLDDLYEDY